MLSSEEIQEYEYIIQDLSDEFMEIDPYCISGIYSVLKTVVKTLKGINCSIKEVLRIQLAAHQFLADITACGGEVNKKVQNLINAIQDIIETTKAIVGISESVCANGADETDKATRGKVVDGIKSSHKCAVNMLRKLTKLSRQIRYALKLIAQIKNVPGDTSKCVLDAVNTLEVYFNDFVPNIKSCSKLPSIN